MANCINIDQEEYDVITDGEDTVNFSVIEDGDFVSGGKYEHKESVIKDKNTGKYYSVFQSRTGSYFTDYHFEDDLEAVEVEPVEVTETIYKIVK